MKGPNTKTLLLVAALAACCISASWARAQQGEGWGTSSSTWRATAPAASAPAPRLATAGTGVSWSAGRGSIPLHAQPRGIWHESSTFSPPATNPATASALKSALPRIGGGFGGSSRAQGAGPRGFTRASIGRRGGLSPAHGAISHAHAARRGNSHSLAKASSSAPGLTSPLDNNSILKPLTAPMPADTLSIGSFGDSMH